MKDTWPNKNFVKITVFVMACGWSLFLSRIQVDQLVVNVPQAEGIANGIVLDQGKTYEQIIVLNRPLEVTRFGLFIRPLVDPLPTDSLPITFQQKGQLSTERLLAIEAISSEGVSYISFDPPIFIAAHEPLHITLHPPAKVSGKLRLQQNVPNLDEPTIPPVLTIAGQPQSKPFAFHLFIHAHPAFAWQIAGLIVLVSLSWVLADWGRRHVTWSIWLYAASVSGLFLVPALFFGKSLLALWLVETVALAGMIIWLRRLNLSLPATLLAAHTFAFTTWFALQQYTGVYWFVAAATLPYIARAAKGVTATTMKSAAQPGWLLGGIVALTLCLGLMAIRIYPTSFLTDTAYLRDILFDTYQAPLTHKVTSSAPWYYFGAYVGLMNAALALLGGIWKIPSNWRFALVSMLATTLAIYPPLTRALNQWWPFPAQSLIIITVLAIAYYAGWGLEGIQVYLGKRDRLVRGIAIAIMVIALLDLLHVSATALECCYV